MRGSSDGCEFGGISHRASIPGTDGAAQPSSVGGNVYIFRECSGSLELVGTLAIAPDLRASPRWRDAVLSSPVFRELTMQVS
jgi:hypothetical protein